jgi:hypothetical protein
MSLYICGLGAVSPAGWGVQAMREALDKGQPLPSQPLDRPSPGQSVCARLVPAPAVRPAFLAHPRLRRTSPITHYAAAAALEAATGLRAGTGSKLRLGVIGCLQSGCVQYSCRFYAETLKDPATASPLLFPETVYAAPASHVAALLENVTLAYSLVGDPASFLQGICLGGRWLDEGRVDACLVFGSEETNWILADALRHLERPAVLAGGAGALCLTRSPELSIGVEIAAVTDAHTYSRRTSRLHAACAMRAQLGAYAEGELLCDGVGDSSRVSAAESEAWEDWTGSRLSPKRILGEGLMAAAAWQCAAACDAVASGRFKAATVSLVGSNQQAVGARFLRAG